MPSPKSRLAQAATDWAVKAAVGSSKTKGYLIWKARDLLVKSLGISDILVNYKYRGRNIRIPAHSGLPESPSRCPEYGRNLERIAAAVASKFGRVPMIDIGANVGDTALAMRSACDGPILCVEASPFYAELCRENLAGLPDMVVVNAFIDTGVVLNVRMVEQKGSGRATQDEGASQRTMTLADVAAEFGFAATRLVKIDTDGFDGRIIEASAGWLRQVQPILFWEFELTADKINAGPGTRVFDILIEAGYDRFLFYSNVGHYIVTLTAADRAAIEDISWWIAQRSDRDRFPPAYADVCAIPAGETAVYEEILRLERGQRAV